MHYTRAAFGALVVVGVALVAYGLTQPTHTSEIRVEGPVDEAAVNDIVVAYGNLTSEHRQLFDRAWATDGSVDEPTGRWDAAVVRFEGEYYDVSVWGGENGWRIISTAAGWGLAGIGVAGLAVGWGLRRWRDR